MSGLKLNHLLPLLLVLVLGLFPSSIESFIFELRAGYTKCITEEIMNNSMTVGKYSLVNHDEAHPLPDSHRITVRVTSDHANYYHHATRVTSGQFAFVAPFAGEYMTCFWVSDHRPQTNLTIDFEWKTGVATKGWPKFAKKNQIDKMEKELTEMYGTINSIHDEMFYLRLREKDALDRNGSINDTMFWLSLLSLFVCLSVVGLQVWYLKGFFEKKKVI